MPERKQPFVNRQMVEDVEFIQTHSNDVLTDLGVLMHILTKRRWTGNFQGWTDCPLNWLGTQSRMGHRRVKESLTRLEEWGIVQGMSTNGSPQQAWIRRAPNYRYDLRRAPAKESEEPEEEVKIEADEQGAYSEGWMLDRKTWTWVSVRLMPSEVATYPVCTICGCSYHPTEGVGRDEGTCMGCYMEQAMDRTLEKGEPRLTLKGPYGTHRWSRAEILEIFQKAGRVASKE